MPGVFHGTWNIEYHLALGAHGWEIKTINIAYQTRNFYTFEINFGGTAPPDTWKFTAQPDSDGMSFSLIETLENGQRRGIRIVFNSPIDPQAIVDGPLCSKIELWGLGTNRIYQPNDMGTFTGTKGP